MSNYWPQGLDFSDCVSPRDILVEAQREWAQAGKGLFDLQLRETTSETGNEMVIVYALHRRTGRTAKLFQIVHRPAKPYPVTIQPETERLPDMFKKEYEKTVTSGFAAMSAMFEYREHKVRVENEWVAASPAEFRENLSRMFQSDSVASQLLNMVVAPPEPPSQDTAGDGNQNVSP